MILQLPLKNLSYPTTCPVNLVEEYAVTQSEDERLLGAQVSNNFLWNDHIQASDKSTVKMLTSRINALMKISWAADFKTRKMLANGLVMSRIIYVIQVYRSASEYLQVLQNKAVRVVTRLRWGTATAVVLNQIGWLSVMQLYTYHSLLLVYKMQKVDKPVYLRSKFRNHFPYQTKEATGKCFSIDETPKSEKTKDAFVYNSTVMWNCLPSDLRKSEKLETFKIKLKEWIKSNVPI